MQKYPIGIQDFKSIREDNYVYIDKTERIYQLVQTGKYFFLPRPRRFGKSLLLSTLKYWFQGENELFKGLWIEGKEVGEPSPVVHISFSSLGYQDLGLDKALDQAINRCALELGVNLTQSGIGPRFKELIRTLGSGPTKLVLLIDEYDKPLVDYIDKPEKAEKNRAILKNFFSVIKDSDPYLRFFFITGVSKFSKVSLFSDLNHLEDLTFSPQAATLTGYTQSELEETFEEEIESMREELDISKEEMLERIKNWYNGYLFAGKERVYNPFSILNFIKQRQFRNYWWESGTPTFLMKVLKQNDKFKLEFLEASQVVFESYTLDNLDWRALLFQTGYLTILNYDDSIRLYQLGYPNMEVQETMYQHLLAEFRETVPSDSFPLMVNIKRALEAGDLDWLIELINTLFATIPHQIFLEKQESFFHAILHLTFSGIGLLTQSEVSTSKGRVDTVVFTPTQIYVIEFKLNATASAALSQIREKRYGSPYLGQEKEVITLGVNFNSESKTVDDWKSLLYETLLIEG